MEDKWIQFDGLKIQEARNFINQFWEYEDSWSHQKLIKIVKANLIFNGLTWLKVYEQDELLVEFKQFKNQFAKRYLKEEQVKTDEPTFYTLIIKVIKYPDIIHYAYKLRKHARGFERPYTEAGEKHQITYQSIWMIKSINRLADWN